MRDRKKVSPARGGFCNAEARCALRRRDEVMFVFIQWIDMEVDLV